VSYKDLWFRVRAARSCGVLHLYGRERTPEEQPADSRAMIDGYVTELGFESPGENWCALSRAQALLIAAKVLERDLAYTSEVMPEAVARAFAEEFAAHFDDCAEFFTNATFEDHLARVAPGDSVSSWSPITEATFDTGVIAVDEHRVGLIWVEDED
jgi:hypothetical protein